MPVTLAPGIQSAVANNWPFCTVLRGRCGKPFATPLDPAKLRNRFPQIGLLKNATCSGDLMRGLSYSRQRAHDSLLQQFAYRQTPKIQMLRQSP